MSYWAIFVEVFYSLLLRLRSDGRLLCLEGPHVSGLTGAQACLGNHVGTTPCRTFYRDLVFVLRVDQIAECRILIVFPIGSLQMEIDGWPSITAR
jgi:hypothetical protein